MKRENIRLAIWVNDELKAIERLLKEGSFNTTSNSEIVKALVCVGFDKIKPLLEERKAELEKQIEEL